MHGIRHEGTGRERKVNRVKLTLVDNDIDKVWDELPSRPRRQFKPRTAGKVKTSTDIVGNDLPSSARRQVKPRVARKDKTSIPKRILRSKKEWDILVG